jgi:hypothetical protein
MNYTHHIMTEDLKNNVNFARLRELYAVIEGIPSSGIDLNDWKNRELMASEKRILNGQRSPHKCGALACAVGWASLYPPFNELGLNSYMTAAPVFSGQPGTPFGWYAVMDFFGLDEEEAYGLFLNLPGTGRLKLLGMRDTDDVGTDKERVLRRIRSFLVRKKVITRKRADELARLAPVN